MKTKGKINKWDLIKLKSFCIAKETINEMKRQCTGWEKTFASQQLTRELVQLNIKMKKWGEGLNRNFSTEDEQMAEKAHFNVTND